MTPLATLAVGDWVATVDGEIVARGASLDEAVANALEAGYDEDSLILKRVAPAGSYIL